MQCAQCKGAKEVDGATAVHDAHRISSPPRLQPHLLGLVAQACCYHWDETDNTLMDGTQTWSSCDSTCDDFVACFIGVVKIATCGVVWIATCFLCGDAAPGVKIECEPCGGTGFVMRKTFGNDLYNRRIFVPSNQGMER